MNRSLLCKIASANTVETDEHIITLKTAKKSTYHSVSIDN